MCRREEELMIAARSIAALAVCGALAQGCGLPMADEAADEASLAACGTFAVTHNSYDGPNYWGTITVKNSSASSWKGFAVAFDVPSGVHCTNDSVPSGAALSPLSGSGSSAQTKSSHCVFTWSTATLVAGASKTFNYSTDSSSFSAARNVAALSSSCGSTSGGGSTGGGSTGGGSTGGTDTRCDATGLTWKTGAKTNFTSYPAPGSAECIQYNGCAYEGEFAACPSKETLSWVKVHNIVSVFPDLSTLKLHDLCLKSGTKTIVVTVLDECADSDCSGCCTQNRGSADELIDIESFTDARWGVPDGRIEWADLGPTTGTGCQ
jgi:hypothetical protein